MDKIQHMIDRTLGTVRYSLSSYITPGSLHSIENNEAQPQNYYNSCHRGNQMKTKQCCLKMTLRNLGDSSMIKTVAMLM